MSPLKHKSSSRGLIQVKSNTAFSHGCASIQPISSHRYSSQNPFLHFSFIVDILKGMRPLGVGLESEWMEYPEVSERMKGAELPVDFCWEGIGD